MMFRGKVWNAESVLDVHTSSEAWPGDKKKRGHVKMAAKYVPFCKVKGKCREGTDWV